MFLLVCCDFLACLTLLTSVFCDVFAHVFCDVFACVFCDVFARVFCAVFACVFCDVFARVFCDVFARVFCDVFAHVFCDVLLMKAVSILFLFNHILICYMIASHFSIRIQTGILFKVTGKISLIALKQSKHISSD